MTQVIRYAPFGSPRPGSPAECPSRAGGRRHTPRAGQPARAAPWTALLRAGAALPRRSRAPRTTFALPFGRKSFTYSRRSPQDGRIQDNKTRFERLPPAPAPRPRLASSGVEPRELDATRRAPVPPSPLTARTHAASLRRRTTITATHTAHRNDAAYLSVFSSLLPLIPLRHEVGPDKYVEGYVPGNAERGLCCSSIRL